MTSQQKIKNRLQKLHDEVKDLHPFLAELFSRTPGILRVDYKQGSREMGTDFVLTRQDDVLGSSQYIGLVVKANGITQKDSTVVARQIEEAFTCERAVGDGSRRVYVNAVWVVSNGSISENAQDFLSQKYRGNSVEFIALDHLARLVSHHYSEFMQVGLGAYAPYYASLLGRVERLENDRFAKDEDNKAIYLRTKISPIYYENKKESKAQEFSEAIDRNEVIFVQGEMGSGKSSLLWEHCKALCISSRDETMSTEMSRLFRTARSGVSG